MQDLSDTLKAIVFDLDDTLYPQISFKRSGFNVVSVWTERHADVDRSIVQMELEAILGQHGAAYPFIFDQLVERMGLEKKMVPEMVRVFIEHEPQINCFEGVLSMLERLRSTYRLGILTDGRLSVQQKKISALGLENNVDRILCSDAMGLEKPAVALFQWFEKTFSLGGEQLMYVGDNPQKDFWGANQRGWHTVQVLTGDRQNTAMPDGFMAKRLIPSATDIGSLLHLERKRNIDS